MGSERRAALVVFAATGFVSGAWAGRLPAVQAGLGLRPAELSLVILAVEAGALAGLPAGGALVVRHGSRRCLRAGFAGYATALALSALAPSLVSLMILAAAMAAANSVVDVAANAGGVELERRTGRPLLPGLHAGHSLGVAAGGLSGVAASISGAGPPVHFAAVGAVALAAGGIAARRLAAAAPLERAPQRRPGRRLALIGVLAFCALLVEGVASNWSAVHLRDTLHAPPAVASAAFTGFALALALGRAIAGRLVARRSARLVTRLAGAATAAAAVVVIAAPSPAPAVAGWAGIGLAVAGVTPIAFAAAPSASAGPAAVAIASATAIGYLGSFTGPPVVGAIAGGHGLSAGLALIIPAALAIAALAGPAMPSRAPGPPRAPRGRPR